MIATLVLKFLASNVMPVILPPVIAWARKFVQDHVPASMIPLVLTIGGAAVNTLAQTLGVDAPQDLAQLGGAAWDGALLGLATVGVHQLGTRAIAWFKSLKAKP